MTEYIIRHEQLEKIFDWIDKLTIAAYGEEYEGVIGKRLALFEYMEVPPPLVRCKDCEYSRKDGTLCMFFEAWESIPGGDEFEEIPADVEPDGFCKWGERKVVKQ